MFEGCRSGALKRGEGLSTVTDFGRQISLELERRSHGSGEQDIDFEAVAGEDCRR